MFDKIRRVQEPLERKEKPKEPQALPEPPIPQAMQPQIQQNPQIQQSVPEKQITIIDYLRENIRSAGGVFDLNMEAFIASGSMDLVELAEMFYSLGNYCRQVINYKRGEK